MPRPPSLLRSQPSSGSSPQPRETQSPPFCPPKPADAARIAEAFAALCLGYSQQLAVRRGFDPAPFTGALMAIIDP
jgi:hypothetical protein